MSTLDNDALDTLTPEEREAIQGSDYTPEELATMQNIAGSGGDNDDNDDDDDDGDGAATGDDGAAAAASAAGDPAGDAGAADGDDGVAADVAAARAAKEAETQRQAKQAQEASRADFVYSAELPADFNDRLSSLGTREAELRQKFRDGELEFDEYDAQRELLFQERSELERLRTKSEISNEMHKQSDEARAKSAEYQWSQTVSGFVDYASKLPEDGGRIDYSKDAEKAADLDAFVKTLAANPANEHRDMRWFLDQAHKRVLALHDLAPVKPAASPTADPAATAAGNKQTADDKLKQAKQGRKPDTSNLPPSIANVPGGDGPGDVGSEFADLDSLTGDQLESAIRKMSPEQRERYSRGT